MRSESEVLFEDNPFTIPVADRVRRLPPYLFAAINKRKYQLRVAGVDVIDLGMGNPTDPPDPMIVKKIEEALVDPRNHRYSVSNGIGNLRKEVSARYLKRYGVRLDPNDEVLACLGSKEGFSHMCLALMGPGDTAIVPAPSFPIHVYSVMLASGNVIALDVRDPEKFLRNIAYTCEHLVPKPKVVVVNFPHNPSSTVIEQDFFVELVRLAKKHNFLVISDFAYADVCYDGYKAPSFLATPGAIDVGVELTSMSKSYSMAGGKWSALWQRSKAITTTEFLLRFKSLRSWPCDIVILPLIRWQPNIKLAEMLCATDFAALAGIRSCPKPACSFGQRFQSSGRRWARSSSR